MEASSALEAEHPNQAVETPPPRWLDIPKMVYFNRIACFEVVTINAINTAFVMDDAYGTSPTAKAFGALAGIALTYYQTATRVEVSLRHYRRTKEHIAEFGTIDEVFFRGLLEKDTKGYCPIQGVFAAAKEAGLKDRFFELAKACGMKHAYIHF